MALMGQSLEHTHLRAPRADGGTLIAPPASTAGDLVARNAAVISAANYDVSGRPLAELARQAREQLCRAAVDYTQQYRDVSGLTADPSGPILLAGHQPQLFHPGVWFKNFVLSGLAETHGATAVNLVIDSDTIKSAALRVPTGSAAAPTVESVPLDRSGAEIPFEERQVLDRQLAASFGERAGSILRPLVGEPLVDEFWPLVQGRIEAGANLGECLSQARHLQEGRFGAATLELPQSRVLRSAGISLVYGPLACQLAAPGRGLQLGRGRVPPRQPYPQRGPSRARPGERGRLAGSAVLGLVQWQQAPPAVVRPPSRGTSWCSRTAKRFRYAWTARRATPAVAAEQLAGLRTQGIKIRTRALVTTLFARLMLGDLFLHGIGGAKYDQVTDLLIGRFFGLEPPAYLTVTATLRLPIEHQEVTPEDQRLVEARLRELIYHPERYADDKCPDPVGRAAAQTKRHWIATPQTIENARTRCRAIRQANEDLQNCVQKLRAQLVAERERLQAGAQAEAILSSRDYAFCLYPAATLGKLFEAAAHAAVGGRESHPRRRRSDGRPAEGAALSSVRPCCARTGQPARGEFRMQIVVPAARYLPRACLRLPAIFSSVAIAASRGIAAAAAIPTAATPCVTASKPS